MIVPPKIAVLCHILIILILTFGNQNLKSTLIEGINKNYLNKIKILGFSSIEQYLLLVIFLFSLFSTIMTLVYSEIFLQTPCSLCWFQRVFMYGIVVLSGSSLIPSPSPKEKGGFT